VPLPVVDHSAEVTEVVSLADIQPPEFASALDHSGEATEVVSLADIQPPDAGPPPLADHSAEPTEVISIQDIQPARPQPASQAAPMAKAAPQSHGQPVNRRRQDTMPIRPMEAEVTQPRANHPQAKAASRHAPMTPQRLQHGDSAQTMNLEEYDPERLKRILAQAQAEAAARSQKDSITPVYYVIGAILALTIIGAAVVIALFL
jgi:hypothetical protein